MKKLNSLILNVGGSLLLIVFLLTAWGWAGAEGIRDYNIGLRQAEVLVNPAVPLIPFNAMDPGENELLPRAWEGAPPQISHLVEDMEVNLQNNGCTDCHTAEKTDDDEPPMSIAHFTDDSGKQLSGARYMCLTCHVTQADAKPLVGNRFAGK